MIRWRNFLAMLCMLFAITACQKDEKTDSLEECVESFDKQLIQINKDLSSISLLMKAVNNKLSIIDIVINESNQYIITFSDNTQITINDSKDNSEKQTVPILGIGIWKEAYYWMQNIDGVASWLTNNEGYKIPVADKDAVTPQLKIDKQGYWMISYDNGMNYVPLLNENGVPVSAIDKDAKNKSYRCLRQSFFQEIKPEKDKLSLVLAYNTTLDFPIKDKDTPNLERIEITGSIDLKNGQNLKISSLLDERILQGAAFSVYMLKSEQYPQLLFVKNSNNSILLMGRDFFAESDNQINARTTAFALIASHPVFAPVEKNDYADLQNLITSSPSFPALCAEIQKSAEAGKDLFDTHNTTLTQAANTVLNELCAPVINTENLLFTRTNTREKPQNLNIYPFQVTPGKDCLEIRNTRLAPPYEYTVRRKGANNIWEEYDTGILPTRDSYGFTDIFKTVGEIHLAEPITIHFAIDGEYDFYFDKTSDRAAKELQKALVNDALSIIGASESDWISKVAEGSNLVIQGGDVKDYIEYGSQLIFEAKKEASIDKASEFYKFLDKSGKILDKFNLFYGGIKGVANEVARILWAIDAPHSVDFCLTNFEEEITPCVQSKLKIISGNNQRGKGGNFLSSPLKVQVSSINPTNGNLVHAKFHQVKFQIMRGNGKLSQTLVKTDANGYAETRWQLGTGYENEKQKVKAVIFNVMTGTEVGTPLEFIATVSDKDYPENFNILAKHSNITSNSINITCTYPEILSGAVFGVTVDHYKNINANIKPWADYKANNNFVGGEYTFQVNNLSPENSYFYEPYILYEGVYYKGEKTVFSTPKEEDIEITEGTIIDLGLSVKWASCNLGASKPEESGEYFLFNKNMEQAWAKYLTNGLRIPTKENVEELLEKCKFKNIIYNGVNGVAVTGPNGNSIFLPKTGYGMWHYEGIDITSNPTFKVYGYGLNGKYWTKTIVTRPGGWWLGAYTLSVDRYITDLGWEDGPGSDPGHYNVYHPARAIKY